MMVKTAVAIPPDTNYQKVILKKIRPEPVNVKVDEDGNWLAEYLLEAGERKEIVVEGKAQVFAEARKIEQRPIDFESLTGPQKYWEVDDLEIKRRADKLQTVRQVYDFVVSSLNYDYLRTDKKIERFGAKKALEMPNDSLCMEFTDLFVALLRAKGVPAREINGYAYTTNSKLRPLSGAKDILHSWAEYYDAEEDRWIQVDPTWENTTLGVDYFSKLDMNHFAFVIHGASSEYPITPGSYKIKDEERKDVNVFFDNLNKEELEGKLTVDYSLPKYLFSFFPMSGKLVVKNSGFVAEYEILGKIAAEKVEIKSAKTLNLEVLPPFSKREAVIELENNFPFWGGSGRIEGEISGEKFEQKVYLVPVIYVFIVSFIGGVFVWYFIVKVAPKTRGLFISRAKK